jgi:RNA polymerase sigma-70 factor (ECF subfamily)
MARNECSNANRSRDRHLTLVDRVRAEQRPPADNTASWVEAESTMAVIRQALAALPANQRDVVELVAWSGLSLADAAAALKISVGTVKSRLSRARARLARTELAALLEESR